MDHIGGTSAGRRTMNHSISENNHVILPASISAKSATHAPHLDAELAHNLERKLSFTSNASLAAQSHSSVVHNPEYAGLARDNLKDVLLYVQTNHGLHFDADRLFHERKTTPALTKLAREYLPVGAAEPDFELPRDESFYDYYEKSDDEEAREGEHEAPSEDGSNFYDINDFDQHSLDEFEADDSDFDDDLDADTLLPPLPPRLPPQDMDPGKLYGLYDFSGPDPLHCTLARDEPVHLVNDLDNYWWLVRKLTKQERIELWNLRGSQEPVVLDDEDGRIGFVPAECLETHGERLARLNCFRNEDLERTSRDSLHQSTDPAVYRAEAEAYAASHGSSVWQDSVLSFGYDEKDRGSAPGELAQEHENGANGLHPDGSGESADSKIQAATPGSNGVRRTGLILKKSRALRTVNKSVTFENLADLNLDDDYLDVVDFPAHYLHVDDVVKYVGPDSQNHSDLLSDLFQASRPLVVAKNSRKLHDLAPPGRIDADEFLIGSYSPDTPQQDTFRHSPDPGNTLHRSQILDRLSNATGQRTDFYGDVVEFEDFTGRLESDLDSHEGKDERDELTPLTSLNLLTLSTLPGHDDRPAKLSTYAYLPILGKLDELTDKLAEFEQDLQSDN